MIRKEAVSPSDSTARAALRCGTLPITQKILCVDDDAPFLCAFSALLELAGFSVTAASDPAQGLALMSKGSFDLAILDYHMPGMNGAQLARKIRRNRPDMPVILLSANDSVPAADLRMFNRCLAKGESFREILLAVRSALPDRAGPRRACTGNS